MKKLFSLIILAAVLASCSPQPEAEVAVVEELAVVNYYGDSISLDNAISPAEMLQIMNTDGGFEGKVEAKIEECCKKKGCWMKVDLGNGEQMRVSFKDYGFFVPKEGAEGKAVIMQGMAYMDTTSVDMLRHLAEDAGKTPEEIEAITEPELTLAFEATGVVIKD
jgi:hypothetical protein